jgi:hypothetical protein
MIKVQVLIQCKHCNGEAYLLIGDAGYSQDYMVTRYVPCLIYAGSGDEPKWISLNDFAKLLVQAQCPHEHTSYQGNMGFSAGDVWDDNHEICNDCGASLDCH